MGVLIDKTYFILDINIPTGSYEALTDSIAKYEPEVLKSLLGYELYLLVEAYANPGSDQRIIDIVEGKDYTVSCNGRDQVVRWNGLKNTELISLIAYYTYYWWQRNHVTLTTQTSEIKAAAENAQAAVMANKSQNAFDRCRELYGFIGQDSISPSLYNFLKDNEDDYPEWIFTDLDIVNCLDL